MSSAVEEIINLIDVRININKELIPKVKSQEKIKKKAKIEELEYLKETILLAYEDQQKGIWLMRLGKHLSSLTKPELEELKENLNLTDDELGVFCGLAKGRSKLRIAEDCLVSVSTVSNRIKTIQTKFNRL